MAKQALFPLEIHQNGSRSRVTSTGPAPESLAMIPLQSHQNCFRSRVTSTVPASESNTVPAPDSPALFSLQSHQVFFRSRDTSIVPAPGSQALFPLQSPSLAKSILGYNVEGAPSTVFTTSTRKDSRDAPPLLSFQGCDSGVNTSTPDSRCENTWKSN